ncbi:hypothetical protein KZP23_15125 [Echinicola marina]|uniref:hypothetical protein n=1 Tax=Echinicola marina TaxID=2859768 RepID=UPI001CF652ED|nr:hypothetical protein [Echinicola marina]UCS92046.1 hypothetical protein KZP23_15125 [Echinicola marina]
MMRRNSIFSAGLFVFYLLGTTSCIPEFDIDIINNKEEKITCKLDGADFAADNNESMLDLVKGELIEKEQYFLLTVYGAELQDNGGAKAVGFKIGGSSIEELQAGNVYDSWEELESSPGNFVGAMGAVEERPSVQSDESIYKAGSNHTKEITLEITAVDHEAQTFSGIFSFEALDDEKGLRISVTEGKFEDVKWKK